jgi:hypothetical protein
MALPIILDKDYSPCSRSITVGHAKRAARYFKMALEAFIET